MRQAAEATNRTTVKLSPTSSQKASGPTCKRSSPKRPNRPHIPSSSHHVKEHKRQKSASSPEHPAIPPQTISRNPEPTSAISATRSPTPRPFRPGEPLSRETPKHTQEKKWGWGRKTLQPTEPHGFSNQKARRGPGLGRALGGGSVGVAA